MIDKSEHLGKVPRKLLDDMSRCEVSLSKALDKIGDALVKAAVTHGFEVLMSRKDDDANGVIPLLGELESASIVARHRLSHKVGVLRVGLSGNIEFHLLPPNDAWEDMTSDDEIAYLTSENAINFDRDSNGDYLTLYG